jgi:hypothetical protein
MLISDGRATSLIREQPVAAEADLQSVFAKNPTLIPAEELGIAAVMVIGREVGLASGSIDLLCLSDDGTPLLIEFKKGPENPDSRRVVAQILDYGSHLWRLDVDGFETLCSRALKETHGTTSLRSAYEQVLGGGSAADNADGGWNDFREGLSRALERGRFHYVIISTHLDPVLKQTMRYLSEVGGLALSGIEVDHFSDEGRHMYVPTAFTVQRRTTGRSPSKTDLQTFLSMTALDARPVWDELLRMLDSLQETLFWGRVGFSFRVHAGRQESVLWGFPKDSSYGVDSIYFADRQDIRRPEVNEALSEMIRGLAFLGRRLPKKQSSWTITVGGKGLTTEDLPAVRDVLAKAVAGLREMTTAE